MKKLTILLLFIVSIFSCQRNYDNAKSNSYKILSVMYDTLAIQIPAPIPPIHKKTTIKDSIKIIEMVQYYNEKRLKTKQIVAINPILLPVNNIEYLHLDQPFKGLVQKLDSIENSEYLDITRIKTNRKDSIIAFNDSLLEKNIKDYLKFNKLLSFSRIAYNEDNTMAVIVASSSTSSLAGFRAIFFLNKSNGKWIIIKEIGLNIS